MLIHNRTIMDNESLCRQAAVCRQELPNISVEEQQQQSAACICCMTWSLYVLSLDSLPLAGVTSGNVPFRNLPFICHMSGPWTLVTADAFGAPLGLVTIAWFGFALQHVQDSSRVVQLQYTAAYVSGITLCKACTATPPPLWYSVVLC